LVLYPPLSRTEDGSARTGCPCGGGGAACRTSSTALVVLDPSAEQRELAELAHRLSLSSVLCSVAFSSVTHCVSDRLSVAPLTRSLCPAPPHRTIRCHRRPNVDARWRPSLWRWWSCRMTTRTRCAPRYGRPVARRARRRRSPRHARHLRASAASSNAPAPCVHSQLLVQVAPSLWLSYLCQRVCQPTALDNHGSIYSPSAAQALLQR
jgi:hypothetical protein